MALYSIWEGAESDVTLKRGAGPPTYLNGEVMDAGAVLVKTFEAASWNEACQIRNDYYGWGRYEPSDTWEAISPDEP